MQLGGQTPLKLARGLAAAACRSGAPRRTRSTSPRTAGGSASCSPRRGSCQPENGTATSLDEACEVARADRLPGGGAAELRAGRPGDGGRATTRRRLERYMQRGGGRVAGPSGADRPLPGGRLRGRPRPGLGRPSRRWSAGILQHIEEAGIHSGDSAAVLPPYNVSPEDQDRDARTSPGAWRCGWAWSA